MLNMVAKCAGVSGGNRRLLTCFVIVFFDNSRLYLLLYLFHYCFIRLGWVITVADQVLLTLVRSSVWT